MLYRVTYLLEKELYLLKIYPTRDSALQSDLPTGEGALLVKSILLGIVLYRVTYLLEKDLYLLDLSY